MRKTILLIVAASFILLLAGCGALVGDNPMGVTGGTDNGYGSLGAGFDGGDGLEAAAENPVGQTGSFNQEATGAF